MDSLDATIAEPRCSTGYRRREPEKTLLYQIVAEHLDPFLDRAEQLGEGHGLPRFVERELRAFLKCGLLESGFARVHCDDCGKDALVAFSCKGRGFCPSCGGRRMADIAAHLVDRVLPPVPVRQWVLSLPIQLRLLLAFNPELCRRVRSIFVRAILGWTKRRAKQQSVLDAETGAVTATQRFGSALNLNVHFHSLVLDGVFHSTASDSPRFLPLPPPSEAELARLLTTIRSRVLAALRRSGFSPADHRLGIEPLAADSPTLAACLQASLQRRVAMGLNSGKPIPRRGDPTKALPFDFPKDRCAAAQGFSLHADVAIPAGRRAELERLARYLVRPPLSNDRLSLDEDGRIAVRLKTPFRDGTTHFLFDPATFLERLAALVPPPRAHQVVYHGVLAPAAALRPEIVPADSHDHAHQPANESDPLNEPFAPPPRKRNHSWAELMLRVFAIDVLACPCGGRRTVIAVIINPAVITKILEHLELASARPPPVRSQRPQAFSEPREPSLAVEPRFVPDPG